jgi:hypothetical protein
MHKRDPVRLSVNSRVMIDADFWKMNPNYSRPRADVTATRPDKHTQGPPPSGYNPSRDQVKSDGVELAHLKEDYFLICCPTVCVSVLARSCGVSRFSSIFIRLIYNTQKSLPLPISKTSNGHSRLTPVCRFPMSKEMLLWLSWRH